MNMERRFFPIFVVIVIVAILIILYGHNIGNNAEKKPDYYSIAVETKNLSICEKIQDRNKKDACRKDVVRVIDDTSVCDEMDDEERNYCYTEIAEVTGNISICNKILDEQNQGICATGRSL